MHWWDQHVEDLETTDLEEICHQVLDLYAQPVTATKDALVSPPPGAAPKVSHFLMFWPPVDLYLIFEKSTWRNQVRQTGFLVYFELDFYCLCSLQKSILKLIHESVVSIIGTESLFGLVLIRNFLFLKNLFLQPDCNKGHFKSQLQKYIRTFLLFLRNFLFL